jgi:EAL domain-containing protein (putative c-di-GMP-specific phosphodiesterase class I)
MRVDGATVSLSAHAGLSLYPTDGLEPSDLLRNAEAAIHHDSDGAPKRIRFFSKSLAIRHRRELDLEDSVKKAIEADSFGIAYQPKVLLPSGKPVGFEALLRYEHPEHGPIPPPTVIEMAERTGLIEDLGHAIFRRVCRDAKRARRETGVRIRFSTNVSPRQLEKRDWSARVERILEETGVDPSLVGIEITESLLVEDRGYVVEELERLASLGMEISLDDFGTGYSHLGYLTRLPLHELKIDRSFVAKLSSDQTHSNEVAGLVVMLGRSLEMRVVAEGAESKEQVEILRSMGCHAVQGYYFARPRPLETFFDDIRIGRIAPDEVSNPAG